MALDDLLKGLAAVVGSGGISGIIIALTGYSGAAREGRRDDGTIAPAIIAKMGGDMQSQAIAEHLGAISYTLAKLVAIMEIKAEEEIADKGFHDRLESKVDRVIIEIARALAVKG